MTTSPITTSPITTRPGSNRPGSNRRGATPALEPETTFGGRLGRAHATGMFTVTWFGGRSRLTPVELTITPVGAHTDRWDRHFGNRRWSTTVETLPTGELREMVGRFIALTFSIRMVGSDTVMTLAHLSVLRRMTLSTRVVSVCATTRLTPIALTVAVSVGIGPLTIVRYEGRLT